MSYELKKIQSENIISLAKCYENYRLFYKAEPNLKGTILFIENEFKNKKSNFFLYLKGDIVIGFLRFNDSTFGINNKSIITIIDLFVELEYRKNNIASELINEMISHLNQNQIAWISVGTSPSNEKAINLFKKSGFKSDKMSSLFFYDFKT